MMNYLSKIQKCYIDFLKIMLFTYAYKYVWICKANKNVERIMPLKVKKHAKLIKKKLK